jgi:Flp pilus assembly protein TadB
MSEVLIGAGLAAGAGVLGHAWRARAKRTRAERRLSERLGTQAEASPQIDARPRTSILRRHLVLPWLVGLALALALYFGFGARTIFAVTFGVILGTVGALIESFMFERFTLKLETQLADAIDLLVGSLRAGGSLMQGLENALRETEKPLRAELEDVVGRIRLGDDPHQVLSSFATRVPLETFQLFATALTVHAEVGGSLAPVLATVGRTIRDRIELSRRVRSQTTQAQMSVMAMLFISYFIAAIMWRTNRERMENFLATDIGAGLFAGAILMQAMGLLMMRRISRIQI